MTNDLSRLPDDISKTFSFNCARARLPFCHVFLAVAVLFFVGSLHIDVTRCPGMMNPDCFVYIGNRTMFYLALVFASTAAALIGRNQARESACRERIASEQKYFAPEVRDYYRCNPPRLRYIKRAIRHDNVARVRALVARGIPMPAREEDFTAWELAELYGNPEIGRLIHSFDSFQRT